MPLGKKGSFNTNLSLISSVHIILKVTFHTMAAKHFEPQNDLKASFYRYTTKIKMYENILVALKTLSSKLVISKCSLKLL